MHNPTTKSCGVFPTMITPYNSDMNIDYGAVDALVEWYWKKGCDGIFASCQSSEIFYLSQEERIRLAEHVKLKADMLAAADKSREPMVIVASGHISDLAEAQTNELRAIAATGVDAVILISNRLDIPNTGDSAWIKDCENLINTLDNNTILGIYECPMPFKRLLTPSIIKWCKSTDRFRFIKDTCCDADLITERIKLLSGSSIGLYNANAQTLLESLINGASGYCGVMANFHPDIIGWLCRNFTSEPKLAETVQAFLCLSAFTESLTYPTSAKYHLDKYEDIPMMLYSRSCKYENFNKYQKSCIDQMKTLAGTIRELIADN
jgi:Dihydrodipicolinate synthase/N-acetylneuraminate lyase